MSGALTPADQVTLWLGDAVWFVNHPVVVGSVVAGIVSFLLFIAWQEKR